MQQVHPIAEHCKWTGDEFKTSFINYGVSFSDSIRIFFNFVYHFGYLYDNTFLIVGQFTESPLELTTSDFFNLGEQFGAYAYWMFYDVGDYPYELD